MRTIFSLLFCPLLVSSTLASHSSAQQMPGMNMPPEHKQEHKQEHKPSPAKKKQEKKEMPGMPGMNMQPGNESDIAIAHSHTASGSAWQPLSEPMHMWSWQKSDWLLMAHGSLFLAYNQQGGPRGVGKLESTNWLMLMEQHTFGRGTLQFREMLSAEPLTTPHGGFPELFQTGETYKGVPLVDRQHPHDVFGELAALYSLPL